MWIAISIALLGIGVVLLAVDFVQSERVDLVQPVVAELFIHLWIFANQIKKKRFTISKKKRFTIIIINSMVR